MSAAVQADDLGLLSLKVGKLPFGASRFPPSASIEESVHLYDDCAAAHLGGDKSVADRKVGVGFEEYWRWVDHTELASFAESRIEKQSEFACKSLIKIISVNEVSSR